MSVKNQNNAAYNNCTVFILLCYTEISGVLQPCPSWGNWFEWADCSTTCGNGVRNRVRICDNENDAISCIGPGVQSEDCVVGVSLKFFETLVKNNTALIDFYSIRFKSLGSSSVKVVLKLQNQ